MRDFWKITLTSFLIFFFSWLFVHYTGINKLAIQSEDTLPAMFMPVTIIKEGTIYADTFFEMIRSKYPHPDDKSNVLGITPFYFRQVQGHYVSAFPLITGFLAIPVYFLPLIIGMTVNWANLALLSHIASALTIAFSGGFLYLLLSKHLLKDDKKSKFLTNIFLFGTINYALISQALWQHGTLQLFIILCLYLLYEKRYLLSGAALGLCVLSRPTAIMLIPFLLIILLAQVFDVEIKLHKFRINKQQLFKLSNFAFGISLAILFFIFYTRTWYFDIANNGYSDQIFVGWLSRFPEGFLGLWFSPNKGILVYSPIFIFSLISIFQIAKNGSWKKKENLLYVTSLAIAITHTLILGRWKHWYGGWSFGYRMASDIIPFLVLAMVPLFSSSYFEKFKKIILALFIFSVLVQLFGIAFYDGIWHAAYDNGFNDTAWLWSIKDGEFVFNVRRLLVKLGYLERACPVCL